MYSTDCLEGSWGSAVGADKGCSPADRTADIADNRVVTDKADCTAGCRVVSDMAAAVVAGNNRDYSQDSWGQTY